MSRCWLDDDDELTWPTNMRDTVWGVLLFLIGITILIVLPPTQAGWFLLAGWMGTLSGLGFLIKGLSS